MAERTPLSTIELLQNMGGDLDRELHGPFVPVRHGESYDHSIVKVGGELLVHAGTARIARAEAEPAPAPIQAPPKPRLT